MKKYLFSNFLKEKTVYQACKDYWEIKIYELFYRNKISGAKSYLNTTFGDGTDFFNGNPIINYYFEETGKAIRIIQEEPNPKDLEIASWVDKFETDSIKVVALFCIGMMPATLALIPSAARRETKVLRPMAALW